MTSTTYHIVAVGRAYTDIISHVSAEFLRTHHIPLNGQRECPVAELKKIQEALPQSQMIAGGPSANSVAIISALGGKAGFFGKIYNDQAGECFLNDFKQRKVDICCDITAKTPALSATCLVLLTDTQRSFAYNPGCADYFSNTDFEAFDFSLAKYFLIEAHLLTSVIAKSAILNAMQSAENKTSIVINLQGITQWHASTDALKNIISKANIIIGNQNEQTAFTQAVDLLQLSSPASQLIVTTQGVDGAKISTSGRVLYHAPSATPKKFVSSNGAGDAFIAGFLLGLSIDMSLEESLQHAVLTASAILEEKGARPTQSFAHLFSVY